MKGTYQEPGHMSIDITSLRFFLCLTSLKGHVARRQTPLCLVLRLFHVPANLLNLVPLVLLVVPQ